MDNEIEEESSKNEFAFNEQDLDIVNANDPEIDSNIVNDEHCVSQGVVPL